MRSNVFILLLTTILLVSCKFFGNNSSGKKAAASNISKLALSDSSDKQDKNTSDTIDEDRKHETSPDMLASDDPTTSSASTDKQETKGKLTKEDKEKLNAFFSKTIRYQYSLVSIYNKYARHYNAIATYGDCNNYGIGCFSPGPSARRSKALDSLEKLKLDQEYSKLSSMLKDALPAYDTRTLDEAIEEYKQAISQASEAECRIEKINDYKEPTKDEKEKKKGNVDLLKTVSNVLAVIEKTIETASLAYADAFAIVSDSLSCINFKQAFSEFREAAKRYANGKGDNAADVIVGPILGMSHPGLEDSRFARAKMFARNKTGAEVNKMITAIDKLLEVYKRVKS
ncbi:hypothetical protein [Borrelia sp. A-FGy1]|uniref:hypothetical protein n=1 Tax=Borrelia sp. A-FGy1 TaxID=2608247 RepID=UPI001E5A403A|nr:hypothetical protein [Borrelia sp. A-FGy1]